MIAEPDQSVIEAVRDRLYGLLPAHIRDIDAAQGWQLQAFLEVLATGSAEIDAEIDALYDSMFVETASEAGLTDIAALVASEPLSPLPPDSGYDDRAFIANTVRYRRGKGTARVLEALANDVGGFGAVVVEYFMRLARTQNLIDVRPERPGTGFIVPGTTLAHSATAFDTLARLVDVRSIARSAGRHHVPNVGVHMQRPVVPFFPAPSGDIVEAGALARVPVMRAWPDGSILHPGYFQLAAQPGASLRLFNPDRRDQDEMGRVQETELRDRLHRLPLHLETAELRHSALEGRAPVLAAPPWFDDLLGYPFVLFLRYGSNDFTRVKPAEIRIANLDAMPASSGARTAATENYSWYEGASSGAVSKTGKSPIRCGFDPVTGRLIVATPDAGQPDVQEARIAYALGIGRTIGAGPQRRDGDGMPFDIVDTAGDAASGTTGVTHFVRIVDPTVPETATASANLRSVQSLAKALTEWAAAPAGLLGLIVLTRCDIEGVSGGGNFAVAVPPASELHIVAAQWVPKQIKPGVPDNPDRLGYVVRLQSRFTIDAPLRVTASAPPPPNGNPGVLVLDGLELTQGLSLAIGAVSRLLVRHSTVRAPGSSAIGTTAALDGMAVAIDRCIVGKIRLDFGGGAALGSLDITNSVISADGATDGAIIASSLDVTLANVTLFGASSFKSLEATNTIFTDACTVVRRQSGCVRFSSIADGSTMPRRFRCQPDLALAAAAAIKGAPLTDPDEIAAMTLGVVPLFLDSALDEPTLAMLHPLCSDAIRLGGENDAEMGVFSAAAEGLRMANVTSLFDDYLPFGLEAGLIDDTRSSAISARRNRP